MQLGIFAKTFVPAPLPAILDAVTANGLQAVHFNMVCVGLPSMPDSIDPALCERVKTKVAARHLSLVGLSGTYNMIHPDPVERDRGLRRLGMLAAACRPLGVSLISLCTGSRDPHDQWRFHPDNASPAAWADLTAAMTQALVLAETYDLTLGIEPELANVVNSAAKANTLLSEMQSPRLKVIIDPANLFPAGTLAQQHQILDDALDRLGEKIVVAHAKDIARPGQSGQAAAGTGQLDFPYYIRKLRQIAFSGPLIMHGLSARQVPQTAAFLQNLLKTI